MADQKLDYDHLIQKARLLAKTYGWLEEELGSFEVEGKHYKIPVFHFGDRVNSSPLSTKISVSGGIHGDEPAAVAGALYLLEHLPKLKEARTLGVSLIVCENPTGYELQTRGNWNSLDLNRKWRSESSSPEIKILHPFFHQHPFKLTIELHEDVDTRGFYLYELGAALNEKGIYGEKIIKSVQDSGLAVNLDPEIDGFPAEGGIISPRVSPEDMFEWPKSIFNLATHGNPALTLESAPCLPLETRVQMLYVATVTAIRILSKMQMGSSLRTK